MNWAFYVRSVPFTRGVIAGTESLGGSESACVGLARALVARGHDVTLFVHDLAEDAHGLDATGVVWEPVKNLRTLYRHWTFDVFVSLRMSDPWLDPPLARWRVQWNQDLLQTGGMARQVAEQTFGLSWPVDTVAYVSQYHRRQWEGVQKDFTPLGWVTKNGYDPALVPPETTPRDWKRVIHISRPERGLGPLLELWPAIRARVPEAELRICRYSSMYDKDGWGRICAEFDALAAKVNAEVGGIVWLGELGKPALYQELAEAAVMAYPGRSDFAETSCIAAIEAQACGLPFVGSRRGALAETVPMGVLVPGVAEDPTDTAYRTAFVDAVVAHLEGCRAEAIWYRERQGAGRAHVQAAYTYATLAGEWEARAHAEFARRWEAAPLGIVRQLLHEDDHLTALAALGRLDAEHRPWAPPETAEIEAMRARCRRAIAGQEHSVETYTAFANTDTAGESKTPRFELAQTLLAGATRVLDVACGNGAAALRFLQEHPTREVWGIDYSPGLIAQAQAAAEAAGVGARAHFAVVPVYDYATHTVTPELTAWVQAHAGQFDALFCGEFLEHCANARGLIDALEPACRVGAFALYTMPHGPFEELLERGLPCLRGHVHHWEIDDLQRVFGPKAETSYITLGLGLSVRNAEIGHWFVRYVVIPGAHPAGERDYGWRAFSCRPMQRLSVGILANQHAHDLRRCLDSVYGVADEIVIGDSTTDGSSWVTAVAKDFGARVIPIAPPTDVVAQPDGFAGARNAVLAACTGEWFLWIDSDETLEGAARLSPYLVTGPFNGYAIRQNHLQLDAPMNFDTPVRVFKRRPEIRFYGCVHEQPQWGHANGDILPGLELHDVTIAHIGYRTESLRRQKAQRNLPLLKRNHERFPDRQLNPILDLRECVLRAGDALREENEALAQALLSKAILLFETECADPANRYHGIARPWYDMALANLPSSWQFEVAAAGTRGTLNGKHAKPERVRFRRLDDFRAWWAHKGRQLEAGMVSVPIETAPVVDPAEETARELASE